MPSLQGKISKTRLRLVSLDYFGKHFAENALRHTKLSLGDDVLPPNEEFTFERSITIMTIGDGKVAMECCSPTSPLDCVNGDNGDNGNGDDNESLVRVDLVLDDAIPQRDPPTPPPDPPGHRPRPDPPPPGGPYLSQDKIESYESTIFTYEDFTRALAQNVLRRAEREIENYEYKDSVTFDVEVGVSTTEKGYIKIRCQRANLYLPQ